jgi:methylated-DNA-[protein]-cysteine S-methyltransferase
MTTTSSTSTMSLDTSVGRLVLEGTDEALTGVWLPTEARGHPEERVDGAPVLLAAAAQLEEYFAGTRTEFDLPLEPQGTAFQLEVWEQLRRIPFGTTITYGELARRVGRPGAARAVGQANGRNPLPIVVPCHRVVASDGLGGYGGGLAVKRALLAGEGVEAD